MLHMLACGVQWQLDGGWGTDIPSVPDKCLAALLMATILKRVENTVFVVLKSSALQSCVAPWQPKTVNAHRCTGEQRKT